jgi:membrane dipeptidase
VTAAELHTDAIVVDAACPREYWRVHRDRWVAGGATACALTLGVFHPAGFRGPAEFLYDLADVYRILREPGLRLATSAADIREAKAARELAVIFHFQGTEPIEYEPALLEGWWRMGVRVVQLAYNRRNPLCDGCAEPTDVGLSQLGRRAIAEMNRLGLLVDVSHTGVRSALEAVEASTAPVVASHANAFALHGSRRNLPDELIKAIAASGGVVGAVGYTPFVGPEPRTTLDRYVDHIAYMSDLVGPEHVGIGIDYTVVEPADFAVWERDTYGDVAAYPELYSVLYPTVEAYYPEGLERPDRLPALTERLLERGFDEDDVRGILGENWLRVYEEVWQ